LNTGLGVARGGKRIGDVGAPTDDLLVLVVVEDSGNLMALERAKARGGGVSWKLTFCLVWLPAPGHSVMMSSLASVFVAKAKATPEKVVPWERVSGWSDG
jgi:hypothetical protein